ncbi:MAG: response regulator transcription factor [Candidatus Doudnabacteria bacterium]
MRLLVISNNDELSKNLKLSLGRHHFYIDIATEVQRGQFWARTTEYDLIIIEHNSVIHAGQITYQLRDKNKLMPVLALVDQLTSNEAVSLYNNGVDDYASKNCSPAELIAKIKALLRRPQPFLPDVFMVDDLRLNAKTYQVTRGKKSIYLTKKEFALLEHMIRNQEQVVSKSDLIEHVWDINADLFSNTLETHILNIRKKIEGKNKPKLLHTIPGRGYRIALKP